MKQKLLIFGSLLLLIIIMIGLNAASYIQKVKEPDSEMAANRSSFNPGSTGTMAYFALLSESGRNVKRWQLPIASLEANNKDKPSTFIIVGPLKRKFTEDEFTSLQNWILAGGRLVVIDRDPASELVGTTTDWRIEVEPSIKVELFSVDPADQTQMTAETPAVKPSQISWLTVGVNAIQPSRFASTIRFERFDEDRFTETENTYQGQSSLRSIDKISESGYAMMFDQWAVPTATPIQPPPPAAVNEDRSKQQAANKSISVEGNKSETTYEIESNEQFTDDRFSPEALSVPKFAAPLTHFVSSESDLVVEAGYGNGTIVYVSDPFMVSNGGINMADNVQFALNLAGSGNIAFDEFHHGYGSGNNRVLEYFQGTPLVAIILQIFAIIALLLYSRSRRFARIVPEPEPNRLSKLEYVEAMSEIQRGTKAYDLAIENIYSDFRRQTIRMFGLGNIQTSRHELAAKIAEKIGTDQKDIEALLAKCEDVMHGEPTGRTEVLRLATELRTLEEKLNFTRKRSTRI